MKQIIVFTLFLAVLSACQRESFETEETGVVVINPSQDEIQGSISGIITNEDSEPVADAYVHYGGQTYRTDQSGSFFIADTKMYGDGTYLTVQKDGFINGSRTFYPSADELNQVRIEMISERILGLFETSTGGKVVLDETQDAYVEFPDGQYLTEDGISYSGTVHVQGVWLDPQVETTALRMPGNLTGLNEDKELRSLISYGFVKVQMLDMAGNLLKLPEGQRAAIYFPTNDMIANPQSLGTWHFDDQNGIWIEEGAASLTASHYVAEVSHFTFWNVTQETNTSFLDVEVKINDTPASETMLQLNNPETGFTEIKWTTDQGKARFLIPSNTALQLEVFHECATAVETRSLAPIVGPSKSETIDLEWSEELSVMGEAKSCTGENISNALVYLEMGAMKKLYRTDENGEINIPLPRCEVAEYSLTLIDEESNKASDPIFPESTLGEVALCNEVQTGYHFEFNDINWLDELRMNSIQSWTVSTITGTQNKLIFNPTIESEDKSKTYFAGTFIINPDGLTANYLLYFDNNGFSIKGTCDVQEEQHQGIKSYRFLDTTQEIRVRDAALFNSDITEVDFNVVYYN